MKGILSLSLIQDGTEALCLVQEKYLHILKQYFSFECSKSPDAKGEKGVCKRPILFYNLNNNNDNLFFSCN